MKEMVPKLHRAVAENREKGALYGRETWAFWRQKGMPSILPIYNYGKKS